MCKTQKNRQLKTKNCSCSMKILCRIFFVFSLVFYCFTQCCCCCYCCCVDYSITSGFGCKQTNCRKLVYGFPLFYQFFLCFRFDTLVSRLVPIHETPRSNSINQHLFGCFVKLNSILCSWYGMAKLAAYRIWWTPRWILILLSFTHCSHKASEKRNLNSISHSWTITRWYIIYGS